MHKLKFKWIKDLNIKHTKLNFIEEKVESTLECIGTGDHFLNIAQTLRELINKWEGPPETEKLLFTEGHGQQDKTAAYRMGKELLKPQIIQRSDLQNIQRAQET